MIALKDEGNRVRKEAQKRNMCKDNSLEEIEKEFSKVRHIE